MSTQNKIILDVNVDKYNIENIENSISPIINDKLYSFDDYIKVNVNINNQLKTVSEHNYQEPIDKIIKLREYGYDNEKDKIINEVEYTSTGSANLPIDVIESYSNNIDEYIENKNILLKRLGDVYDYDFCKNIYSVGYGNELTLHNNRLKNVRIVRACSDNIIDDNLNLYILIRECPIKMRRIRSSSHGYIFIYPEYLLKSYNNNYEAANGILVKGYVDGIKFYSSDELFDDYKNGLDEFSNPAVVKIVKEIVNV